MKYLKAGSIFAATTLVATAIALPASATASVTRTLDDLIPELSTTQTQEDLVPSTVNLADFEIAERDVRRIGADEVAEYWVATQGSDKVCLVVHIPGGSEISAATCGLLSDFYRTGLSLETGPSRDDPSHSTEAYLLPQDVDPTAIAGFANDAEDRGQAMSANLIAGRPGSLDLVRTEVKRADLTTFNFAPMER